MTDYRRPKDEVAANDPEHTTAICPRCEGPATTSIEDDTVEFGDLDIAITRPIRACPDCDIQFVDHVGARIETEAIYHYHGLLTPWQIRTVRERRKLSRTAFAEITGLGEATIKRWESGAVAQNRSNDRYLRLLDTDLGWAMLRKLGATVDALRSSKASSSTRTSRFRCLKQGDALRAGQAGFRLRPAAA